MLSTLLAAKDWRSIARCLPGRRLKAFNCLPGETGTEIWLQVDPINPAITHVNKQQF